MRNCLKNSGNVGLVIYIYFAAPYSSWQKGGIAKCKRIDYTIRAKIRNIRACRPSANCKVFKENQHETKKEIRF